MEIETQSLFQIMKSRNPTGRVAITTEKTMAYSSMTGWSDLGYIPIGNPVLILQVEDKNFVKVFWDEKTAYVNAEHLRLIEIANIFNGKKFAITGELSIPRDYYKSLIKLKGGYFNSAVSKVCDYLIIGLCYKKSLKLKKAERLGIKIITEQQFLSMIASRK